MAEYVSHSTPLADHLSGGIDKSLASLEKMIDVARRLPGDRAAHRPAAEARPPAARARDDLGTRRRLAGRQPAAGSGRGSRTEDKEHAARSGSGPTMLTGSKTSAAPNLGARSTTS